MSIMHGKSRKNVKCQVVKDILGGGKSAKSEDEDKTEMFAPFRLLRDKIRCCELKLVQCYDIVV